ncbi:DUF6804 family protein [Chryseobacterium sp.]|uniref:DUF6804 family protein n=1 Tax=Chryseobacterium sp. TaxID=1871047 RepID=UPI0025C3739F|nr:DUF6804 family protein [Chryseobacterium sp.]
MKPFFTFCAISCFIGVFTLPIEYYTFLRILVSTGAALVIYYSTVSKEYYLSIIFLAVLFLFNPLFPIYLYRKSIWIPLDIIVGVLFLLLAFVKKPTEKKDEEPEEETEYRSVSPSVGKRDIILNPRIKKQE